MPIDQVFPDESMFEPLPLPGVDAVPDPVFPDESMFEPLGYQPKELILSGDRLTEVNGGTISRYGDIFRRGFARGDAGTELSKLYFEQYNGNDTIFIKQRIEELRKTAGAEITTDGTLEEIIRGTAQQLPVLRSIFGKGTVRAMQGGIAFGTVGLSYVGIGAIPGFFGGIGAGFLAGSLEQAFILETGDLFNEISQFKDNNGKLIDPLAARTGATMGGALSAGLELIPLSLLVRLVPGSKKVIGKLGDKALTALKIPKGTTAFRKFIINISTIITTETITEAGQEIVKIAAGELTKLGVKGEFERISANDALDRVGDAVVEALKATPLIATGFSAPRYVVDIAEGRAEARKRPDTKQERLKDVSAETVDGVTNKIKEGIVSKDLKSYDPGPLTQQEKEDLDIVGIQVARNGTIIAEDAELIAAESMRRTNFFQEQVAKQEKTVDKEKAAALRQVSRARIRKIDSTIKSMDERIDATMETIDERKAQGKTTKSLDNRVNSLLKKREILDEERVNLLTEDTKEGKVKKALRAADKQVELKGAELLRAQRRTAKARERAVQSSLRAALKMGRDNIKAAQAAVIDVINKSSLPDALKGKFLNDLKNVQTLEQLKKAVPRIQTRIDNLLRKGRRKVLLSQLKKTINTTKVKRHKGKFGPQVQEVLDVVRKAFNLSKETAQAILDERAESGTTEIPTAMEALENRILALRSDQAMTDISELEMLLESIVNLREVGKGIRKADILKKQEKSASLREEFIELMGPVRKETDKQRKRRETLMNIEVGGFLGMSAAWWNKIKRVMRSPDKERVDEFLNELILFDESRNLDTGTRRAVRRFNELMMGALNTTSQRTLLRVLQKSETEQLNLGAHTHADGTHKLLDIKTRAQLRKRIMELKDADLKASMMNEEKGNKYTPEIINVLENAMTEQDWRMVDAQLQFYEEYYVRINEVYERVYGFSLPKLEFYSPIKRQFENEKLRDEFMKGIIYRGGVAPSSLKGRKPNIRTIKAIGDLTAFHSHISEMEYFIAFAEKVQQINHVVGNPQVQDHIRDVFGSTMLSSINDDVHSFANRGVQNSVMGEETFQILYRNFTFAQLGAKPQIGLKQLASFAAYAEDVKITDFTAGIAEFIANPRKALRILNESDFFRNRGIDIDQDYKAMTKGGSNRKILGFIGRNPTLAHVLMMPIKWGDKGAIAIGGYAHYYAMMKKTGDKKKSLRSFELLSVRTQQSTDIDQMSSLQRTSSLMRVFTRFMSSANALARAEYNALVDLSGGRITKREFAKRFIILHIFIPGLIQFVANGFRWDDEDQLVASIFGALNGVFIVHDVFDAAIRLAVHQFTEDGEGKIYPIEGGHPYGFMEDFFLALDDFAENGIPFEDIIEGSKAIDGFLDVGGALTGVAFKTIVNELRGFARTTEQLTRGRFGEEFDRGLLEGLGYSTYTIDKVLDR